MAVEVSLWDVLLVAGHYFGINVATSIGVYVSHIFSVITSLMADQVRVFNVGSSYYERRARSRRKNRITQ